MLEYPAPYLLAVPGEEYVAYLRYGGLAKIDLRPSTETDTFGVRWVDPVTEKIIPSPAVQGGAVRSFRAPNDDRIGNFKDCVLHVTRKPSSPPSEALHP
jgi:hypothetical protein